VSNEAGDVEAINTADGSIVWSDSFGVPIHATPSVFGGDVWFGTAVSGTMIKVNKDTGQVECRVSLGAGVDYASPVIGTPPGGVPTVYVGVQDNGAVSGPMMAINESTCAVEWQKSPYPTVSGSWNPDAFGVNANGVPLVIMGSGDPDCSIYALNANTGATLWRVTSLVGGLNDFGAGTVISPPGNNGIADGMAYHPGQGPDPLRHRSDHRQARMDVRLRRGHRGPVLWRPLRAGPGRLHPGLRDARRGGRGGRGHGPADMAFRECGPVGHRDPLLAPRDRAARSAGRRLR
jgi:hypothetical protein